MTVEHLVPLESESGVTEGGGNGMCSLYSKVAAAILSNVCPHTNNRNASHWKVRSRIFIEVGGELALLVHRTIVSINRPTPTWQSHR